MYATQRYCDSWPRGTATFDSSISDSPAIFLLARCRRYLVPPHTWTSRKSRSLRDHDRAAGSGFLPRASRWAGLGQLSTFHTAIAHEARGTSHAGAQPARSGDNLAPHHHRRLLFTFVYGAQGRDSSALRVLMEEFASCIDRDAKELAVYLGIRHIEHLVHFQAFLCITDGASSDRSQEG